MKKECCTGVDSHEDDCCWTLVFKRIDEQNKEIFRLTEVVSKLNSAGGLLYRSKAFTTSGVSPEYATRNWEQVHKDLGLDIQ